MRIDIMTLFPDTVGDMMNESILGRAQERDLIRIEAWQIRDYTTNKQNQVDDYPYGGGHGAVLQADPLFNCWQAICDEVGVDEELKLMLSHMILSHHDLPEFGSPKPPMFPEAEILHEIDLMDARMYEMNYALRSAQPGGFTERIWSLERKLYRRKSTPAG